MFKVKTFGSGIRDMFGVARCAPGAVCIRLESDEWDALVEAAPGGDLVQTTDWAEAKRALGFETSLVLVRKDDALVGGAHIIIKRFGPFAVGYIARGPLIAGGFSNQIPQVFDEIERAALAHRVLHMIVQPPQGGERVVAELRRRGYSPGAPAVAPAATLRIDLTQSLDQILASFSSTRRKQLRRSQRGGIETRMGSREDLDVVLELHRATARRQQFQAMSWSYLHHHWDVLHARNAVQLVLAYYDGRPVAGKLLTLFRDTVSSRLGGWTGGCPKLYPNLACHWGAITWAKLQGIRYYDLGGMDPRYAELLRAGQPIPEAMLRSADNFKASLGAEPVLLPGAWHFTFAPFGHLPARLAYAALSRSGSLRRVIDRFRNGFRSSAQEVRRGDLETGP